MDLFLALVAFLTLSLSAVESIRFTVKPNSKRCLKEEVMKGVLVSGEYDLSDTPGHKTDITVDPTAARTVVKSRTMHPFALTRSTVQGVYQPGKPGILREFWIIWKSQGIIRETIKKLAKSGKMTILTCLFGTFLLQMKLQQLEDLSEAVVKDFAYMRQREEEMRDTNESTNSRVLYFSIFSMCCLLGLATWQVLYLRRFFKAKKLIE
ncbi:unnamed protein product [Ixodes hexagonus]